uniref:ARAD1C25630p n=1 Tax=Blastobotrys adeninivorans TaxID=409370 RepID=A0A060T7Y7_BLAAD
MANSAAKKLAASNTETLKGLHIAFAIINVFVILGHFGLGRPANIRPYILFSLPSFFLQYQLERIGRPKYDSKGLVHPGEDLSMGGLTEWMQDVVYLTWVCDILLVITSTNMVWYLFLAVPGYAAYKIYTTFIKSGRSPNPEGEAQAQAKSKRQEKLDRKNKRIRYVSG